MKRLIAIIPGNPGDAVFFERFIDHLETAGHDVLCWDHPSLSRSDSSLLPLAAFHAASINTQLAMRRAQGEEVELTVIGYSLGGYITHLMAAHDLIQIDQVVLLFPFVTRPTPRGMRYLKACATPAIYHSVIRLFRLLPERRARQLLVRLGVAEHQDWLYQVLNSPRAFSYFALAEIELQEIATRRSCNYLLDHPLFNDPERFTCLFTDGDRWVPEHVHDALEPFAHRFDEPVPHDFILFPETCRRVADQLLELL